MSAIPIANKIMTHNSISYKRKLLRMYGVLLFTQTGNVVDITESESKPRPMINGKPYSWAFVEKHASEELNMVGLP